MLSMLMCNRLDKFEKHSIAEKHLIFPSPSASDEEPEPSKKMQRSSCNFGSSTFGTDNQTTRCSSVFLAKCMFTKAKKKEKKKDTELMEGAPKNL